MALFGRGSREPAKVPPKAVLAAAMPMSGPGVVAVGRARKTDRVEAWQRDAWYFYDSIGEVRSPINWISNAVSQATPFAAELDPETGLVTGPTENTAVQRAAALVLGGSARRAQLLSVMATCWQVPGEAWIIIRPVGARRGISQPDEWLVLSGDKVIQKGDSWKYTDPMTGRDVQLGSSDRLIRVWCPHPNDQAKADSSLRPAIPVAREIEKASMNISSRLDSRLASNGLLAIPQEMNFPTGDHESMAASFTASLVDAMEAALSNPGTAAAHVPIVFEMPLEMIDTWRNGWMDLASAMDSAVPELRSDALSRLASTLDMPKPVAEGTQSEANHWSAWQVEESTYKIYIEPLLQHVGDAITTYWFRSVLTAMGVPDPELFVIEWDTSAIVRRPDATEDLDHLYDLELISDDYRRAQSGIPDDAIPADDEKSYRLAKKAALADPSLLQSPEWAQLLGLPVTELPEPPAPTMPEEPDAPGDGRALPDTQDEVPDGLVAAAELIVFDALSRAGGRLLTREHRGKFGSVPKHELHTVIPAGDAAALLADSFLWADRVADAFGVNRAIFAGALGDYVSGRIREGLAHSPGRLRLYLRAVL